MKARITKEPADICEYYTQDCSISFLATVTYHPPKNSHRNAPCPCGSGKKYKRCCLIKENRQNDKF